MIKKNISVNSSVTIGDNKQLTIFAGPCVIESRDLILFVAEKAKEVTEKLGLQFVFKSSFTKANRSSLNSFTGPGIDKGLKLLEEVKKTFSVPILTDIHEAKEAKSVSEVADILQIPAFLCRQTNLLLEAGKTGRVVTIKKGQFLAPESMRYAAEKIVSQNNDKVLLCERGSTFGYGDLVVDYRSLKIMSDLGYHVVFDCTHSVQKPGRSGNKSGGAPQFIEVLSKAAVATGYVNVLFMEIHPEPLKGLSDATNMLPLDGFEPLLTKLKKLFLLAKEV